MKERHIDHRTMFTYWNRALHLIGRLKRLRPLNEQVDERKSELLFLARAVKVAIVVDQNSHIEDELFMQNVTPFLTQTMNAPTSRGEGRPVCRESIHPKCSKSAHGRRN